MFCVGGGRRWTWLAVRWTASLWMLIPLMNVATLTSQLRLQPQQQEQDALRISFVVSQRNASSQQQQQRPTSFAPRVTHLSWNSDRNTRMWISDTTTKNRSVEAMGRPCCEEYEYFYKNQLWDEDDCEYMADWQRQSFPTCNVAHELTALGTNQATFRGKGVYRYAWIIRHNSDDKVVMRTLRYNIHLAERDLELPRVLEEMRLDALAMERLTGRGVIAVYSHCGYQLLSQVGHRTLHSVLHKKRHELTYTDKLTYGLQVAQLLQSVHSIDDSSKPTLAHGDFHISNILTSLDGTLLLNDFNQGMLLRQHANGTPCQYANRRAFGLLPDRRPPERFNKKGFMDPVALDVFALGIMLIEILMGRIRPFRKDFDSRQSYRLPRVLPISSELAQATDIPSRALLYSALACLSFRPQDRPSAKVVADGLSTALAWAQQGKNASIEEIQRLFTDTPGRIATFRTAERIASTGDDDWSIDEGADNETDRDD